MSASENISRNVRRLRNARRWTQEEAAQRFIRITGAPSMSKASWSAGERAAETRRSKSWTANEIAALAELFDVPVGDLFQAQPPCRACEDNPPAGFTCNTCGGAA